MINLFSKFKNSLILRETLPLVHRNEVILERSLSYFDSLETPKRVYELNLKMKLILILVNPVKRAISYLTHRLSFKTSLSDPIRHNSFDDSQLSKLFENTVLNAHGEIRVNNNRSQVSHNYFTRGKYVIHYKRWLEYFPKEQILILNGENFIINPYEEIKKVEKFINVKPYYKKNYFVLDESKSFYCFKQELKKSMYYLGSDKGRLHPFVRNEVLLKLKNVFKPYDEELFKLINQNQFW